MLLEGRHILGMEQTKPKPLAQYPELMTVAETAQYLRIALSTCYLLASKGATDRSLPAVKVGGRTFILRDRLADYLAPSPSPGSSFNC